MTESIDDILTELAHADGVDDVEVLIRLRERAVLRRAALEKKRHEIEAGPFQPGAGRLLRQLGTEMTSIQAALTPLNGRIKALNRGNSAVNDAFKHDLLLVALAADHAMVADTDEADDALEARLGQLDARWPHWRRTAAALVRHTNGEPG